MMHRIPTATLYLFSLLLFLNISILYGMEHNQLTPKDSVISYSLPKDVMLKIFACADLATKKIMQLTCSTLSMLAITDILKHSPLIISRKDHLYHMINTAQRNDSETFMNLLCNANNCEHTDICNTVSYFLPQDSTELKLIDIYSKYHDPVIAKQLLRYIMAVYRGDEESIEQYLIKNMKRPENRKGMNPLTISAYYHFPQAINELLLTQNISLLNMPAPDDGCTPLGDAAAVNNIEMCKFLLSFKGIEINTPDNDGITPLTWAAQCGHADIVTLLINYIVDHNQVENILQQQDTPLNKTPWFFAIGHGHVNILKTLLTPVDFEVPYTAKPLHIATRNNQLDVVKMLLEHPNTNINAEYNYGNTALLIAAINNLLSIAEILLKNYANIDITDNDKQTPLWCASHEGHTEMVALLLTHKADVTIASDKGRTPLHIAIKKEHMPIIRLLSKHTPNPLHIAVDSKKLAVVTMLLKDLAIDINAQDEAPGNHTLLHIAIFNEDMPIIQTLIKHGANPNMKIKDNVTPLMLAAEKNNYEVCEILLKNGAEIDAADSYGWTSLLTAADKGYCDIVQLLLTYSANINHQTNDHRTALLVALTNKHELIVNLLLEQPDITISEKESELLIAFRHSQEEES